MNGYASRWSRLAAAVHVEVVAHVVAKRVPAVVAAIVASTLALQSSAAQATKTFPAKPPAAGPNKAPAKPTTAVVQPPAVQVPPGVAPDSLFPYRPGVDVQQYNFLIQLPQAGTEIKATAIVRAWRRMTVDTLVLDLLKMTVDSVRVGNTPREFKRDSATLRIPLKATDGAEVNAVISYHGSPDDGLIIRETPDRVWSAFGDNWPNRARNWLPTVDHPSDKALVSWTIDAPPALTVVANGMTSPISMFDSELHPQVGKRTKYRMNAPIPTYLMVLAAAKLEQTPLPQVCGVREANGCINQSVYTFPQEKSYAPGPFVDAPKIVSFFAKTAGPYAYEQLNHLQSATRFGGMENATAIFYSDNAFKNHSVGTGLIAHETAHQWFGDAVTPRRWQDVWLSEGFASYFAPLYTQSALGDSAFKVSMAQIRTQILAAPVVLARPVVDTVGAATPNELLNANSYQKGAFVLHMLRTDIGDEAFFQGIRDYQKQYRNGTATTENLRVAFEKASGASLVPFFDQWLHRPGYPEIEVRWGVNAAKKTVVFNIHQGGKSGLFAVPLVVELRDAEGKSELHTLHLQAEADQSFERPLKLLAAPSVMILDPRVELLARLSAARP